MASADATPASAAAPEHRGLDRFVTNLGRAFAGARWSRCRPPQAAAPADRAQPVWVCGPPGSETALTAASVCPLSA